MANQKNNSIKERKLTSANTALQKSNTLLEITNRAITRGRLMDSAAFDKQIESSDQLTKQLKQTVEQGIKKAKTSKATLQRKDIELGKLNKEILTFGYISSHDLQEPLRNLQIITSILLEKEGKNLSDQGKEYLKKLHTSAHRIQHLIQDLSEYSSTNKIDFKHEPTNLNQLVSELKTELADSIKRSNAHIVSSELHTLSVVPFQILKLFRELICNAIKFARPGLSPEIIIKSEIITGAPLGTPSLSLKKKYCHLSFADNGIGFQPLFMERVFEIFQKLNGKTYKGSGIGLATCRKIVENHNGVINCTSEPGQGSTFHVYIPYR